MKNSLKKLRRRIDRLDREILGLLNQRLELVREVSHAKALAGVGVYAPERESELIDGLMQANRGPLTARALTAIYREILSSSRSLQKPMVIGYVGRVGAAAHTAAREIFGSCTRYQRFQTAGAAKRALEMGRIDFWVSARTPPGGDLCQVAIESFELPGRRFYILSCDGAAKRDGAR